MDITRDKSVRKGVGVRFHVFQARGEQADGYERHPTLNQNHITDLLTSKTEAKFQGYVVSLYIGESLDQVGHVLARLMRWGRSRDSRRRGCMRMPRLLGMRMMRLLGLGLVVLRLG